MPYRLIDLFAGCGAMTRGFVDTGRFTPVLAVESNPDAAASYAANFGDEHLRAGPIQEVREFPAAEALIGGPPCQGFSPLNRDREAALSRDLWREFLRAVDQVRPAVFVMENVPELLDADEYIALGREVERRGYRIEGRVLNAADYGVPQRRRRAVAIGSRVGILLPWPNSTHRDPRVGEAGHEPWIPFREAVEGLPLSPDGCRWHRPRNPWPESVRRYRAVPPDGGNRFQMQTALDREGLGHLVPPCWRKHTTGSYDVFGRLWWDRPAPTIRTEFYKPEKGRYLHPTEHRAITVREAARLMSMPDDFILPEDQSMTSIGRQIGNAVPPLLARRLGETIAEALDACGSAALERAA